MYAGPVTGGWSIVTRWKDVGLAAVARSSSAVAPSGPSPGSVTPAVTTVRDQSIVSPCAATGRADTRSAIPALASTCLMSILLLLSMSFKERVERLSVEQAVGVRGTEPQLERTGVRRAVEQLDLLHQPIQPQANRGVRDPVLGCGDSDQSRESLGRIEGSRTVVALSFR